MSKLIPFPVKIPPGVVKGNTDSDTPGRWFDTQLVRWVEGVLRPCGGWELVVLIPDTSSRELREDATKELREDSGLELRDTGINTNIRKAHRWTDNANVTRIGVLCEHGIFIIEGNTVFDVTPIDFVGPDGSVVDGGYGDDDYNFDTYGTPRPMVDTVKYPGPAWSMDNWGEDLIIMSSYDGRLLRWKPSVGGDAAVIPGTPINNRSFVITGQRHVIIFGIANDSRALGWCSQEDIEDWNFADPLNTAGEYFIEPSAFIVGGSVVGARVVFFTTRKVYGMSYLGTPYIYSYEEIGDGMTPISDASMVSAGDSLIWPSDSGFFKSDGLNVSPVPCPIFDWFRQHLNRSYVRHRAAGFYLGVQPEAWFFFPSRGQQENDRYVMVDIISGDWGNGYLERSCGIPGTYVDYPFMFRLNEVYQHEYGTVYGGAERPYAESGAINLDSGASNIYIGQALADHGTDFDSVFYSFFGRQKRVKPYDKAEWVNGPLIARDDGYVDVRDTARDWRMKIQTRFDDREPWSMGQTILRISYRGGR
jgi:hypothetical protein